MSDKFLDRPAVILTEPAASALRRANSNPKCSGCGFACYVGVRIDELNEDADGFEQLVRERTLEMGPGIAEAALAARQRDVVAAETGGRLEDFTKRCDGPSTDVLQDGTLRQQLRVCNSGQLRGHDDRHLVQALGRLLYGA